MEVSHRIDTYYNIMLGSHVDTDVAVVIWLLQRAGYDKIYMVYTWYYSYPQCSINRGWALYRGTQGFFLGRTYRRSIVLNYFIRGLYLGSRTAAPGPILYRYSYENLIPRNVLFMIVRPILHFVFYE